MTHKNSILELILTEEHRYRTNAYRCKKKTLFHVTILTQSYLSIPQKIYPKSSNSTYRPHRPIVRKIRYTPEDIFIFDK